MCDLALCFMQSLKFQACFMHMHVSHEGQTFEHFRVGSLDIRLELWMFMLRICSDDVGMVYKLRS